MDKSLADLMKDGKKKQGKKRPAGGGGGGGGGGGKKRKSSGGQQQQQQKQAPAKKQKFLSIPGTSIRQVKGGNFARVVQQQSWAIAAGATLLLLTTTAYAAISGGLQLGEGLRPGLVFLDDGRIAVQDAEQVFLTLSMTQ